MSKKVAVLFSGGLDSTYLIWKNLKEGNIVTPIYVEITNNEIKTILEKNRILKLHELFKEEFDVDRCSYDSHLKDIQYSLNVGVKANENSLHFKQIPIWILSVVFLQSLDVDEIQIGYVMNDDAISYLDDIQNIYKSYTPILDNVKPLVFPIIKMKKWQMAEELPKKYLDLIFSCENAKIVGSKDVEIIDYEACCECAPCRTILASNYYEIGEFPKQYNENLLLLHSRYLTRNGYAILDKNGENFAEKWRVAEKKFEPYQLSFNFSSDEGEIEK
jgi:7-cyano-7-deazaguanine synthase in queuosine biosynthesis